MLEIFLRIFENCPVNLNVQVREQGAMKALNPAPIKEARFLRYHAPDLQGLLGPLMMKILMVTVIWMIMAFLRMVPCHGFQW